MSILSNYIIQDLIQNVSKGVTETFKFVLERYNSNEVFAYTLYIDDYCSYLGWAANTISHYEIEKVNYPKEDQPFIKWYYPQFAIGLGEVPEKIDSIFNNEIQNILNDANTLISEDNFEQYQAKVYDSIIEGFKKAIENIDKKKTNNVIFFVSIVDSDNSEIMWIIISLFVISLFILFINPVRNFLNNNIIFIWTYLVIASIAPLFYIFYWLPFFS